MHSNQAEIVIIGGGPAGYVAAITAARKGKKVTLIETADLGGTCLNAGCIPTKTLAKAASAYSHAKRLGELGLEAGEIRVNWPRVLNRKEKMVSTLRQGVKSLMSANKIQVFYGQGAFISPEAVSVTTAGGESRVLGFKKAIIASGSVAAQIPAASIDEKDILSSSGVLNLPELPRSLVVIGGGVIGMEFASLFSIFGVKVTVIELLPQVLPGVDAEAAGLLAGEMQKRGVVIRTGCRVEKVEKTLAGGVLVCFRQGEASGEVVADKVLVAAGRTANTGGLGLEKAGVAFQGKFIPVNPRMETGVPGIYAAGDVTGGQMLAHVAFAEGTVAALNAAGEEKEVNYKAVPACVYTLPEVAQAGLGESQAREKYGDLRVGKFPLGANGRAQINMEGRGFVKVVADSEYGEILGITIVGAHATELIAQAVMAIGAEVTLDQLAETMHAHPTVSECVQEAGLVALGTPLHTL